MLCITGLCERPFRIVYDIGSSTGCTSELLVGMYTAVVAGTTIISNRVLPTPPSLD